MTMGIHPVRLSCAFDSGAIEVVSECDAGSVEVKLRADSHADFRQWFHFRVQGARGRALRIRFVNAGEATYVEGWRNYRAVASYDREDWFRVPTTFEAGELAIAHEPARDSVYYAYFEPYSWERHLGLLGRADASPRARVSDLGATLDGRDVNLVTVGDAGAGKKSIWVIARQHPGETMAEWFVEGLLERLLDPADPVARRVLERAVLHVVPNMNPDGSVRGNLRTNAAGANLNREWQTPSRERSPEVFHVRAAMQASGIDAFLDIHGDEGLPYVFTDGNERLPTYSPRMAALERGFADALKAANPDFQTVHGYPADKETKVNLTVASKWAGHAYGGLALTLEMPFKDNADLPDPLRGWNGARSRRLGADTLTALYAMLPSL
ncbi:MAG TPA: M14-type cytosolic carboxypeptidase [Casimicrobiaceae bacterium]|nr:M14-type cytosolic carboxypeptidase [Casimicrobiaceae bacterium]